jgi:hypothetical protein
VKIAGSIPADPASVIVTTDLTHLDELLLATDKPLSRRLVETFRECARNPLVAKADYVQRLKNEMEAALHEGPEDASSQPENS